MVAPEAERHTVYCLKLIVRKTLCPTRTMSDFIFLQLFIENYRNSTEMSCLVLSPSFISQFFVVPNFKILFKKFKNVLQNYFLRRDWKAVKFSIFLISLKKKKTSSESEIT